MNPGPILGFVAASLVLWFTVIANSSNPSALFEWKGLGLVAGGTLSAGLIIFPLSQLLELSRFLIFAVLLKRNPRMAEIALQIVSASCLSKEDREILPYCPCSHPFLKEGFRLIAEDRLNPLSLKEVMLKRSLFFKHVYLNDAKMLSVLAKFPSSFGMLGSTVGLIEMMSNLGKNGQAGIGAAMAMALVATFWGLVFTYMIFMPLSDYALRLNSEDGKLRELIVEGIYLIGLAEDPRIVIDKINSFLPVGDRLTAKKLQTTTTDTAWLQIQERVLELSERRRQING